MAKEIFVNIIGAGLAGCEAALFLADHGIKVRLFDMKPLVKSPAHKMDTYAELVCSNSLKSTDKLTAGGLLKNELELLGSRLLQVAKRVAVPSGGALAVDRNKFSEVITNIINNHKNIKVSNVKITEINIGEPTIVATGPLTDNDLFKNLMELIGQNNCYFFDAIAPIIETDSIDFNHAFWGNRYGKGESKEGDYINCPMTKDEYEIFYKELVSAKQVELKDFENLKVFEGCMPVEVMARRGVQSLRYGPMRPVGLYEGPKENRPYAVLQLRKEDEINSSVNMVGFQTNLLFPEQRRVFGLIPALKNAKFLRFGTMHRNSYVNAPVVLNEFSQCIKFGNVFIAGQLSGVEGYVESIASGLFCAYNIYRMLNKKELVPLANNTMIGALIHHLTSSNPINFQPMNSNYGIIACNKDFKDKDENKKYILEISEKEILNFKNKILPKRKKVSQQ